MCVRQNDRLVGCVLYLYFNYFDKKKGNLCKFTANIYRKILNGQEGAIDPNKYTYSNISFSSISKQFIAHIFRKPISVPFDLLAIS